MTAVQGMQMGGNIWINLFPPLARSYRGVFGFRTRVDGIYPCVDFGIWISILSVWLDGWGGLFFCLVG
jgi:hypothetical protein